MMHISLIASPTPRAAQVLVLEPHEIIHRDLVSICRWHGALRCGPQSRQASAQWLAQLCFGVLNVCAFSSQSVEYSRMRLGCLPRGEAAQLPERAPRRLKTPRFWTGNPMAPPFRRLRIAAASGSGQAGACGLIVAPPVQDRSRWHGPARSGRSPFNCSRHRHGPQWL